jgi:hypothetical protein
MSLHHLVLRNGYRFDDLVLKAGDIYTAEQFSNVPEQRMVALILGRIIYRGSLQEVESKREKLFGISSNTVPAEIPDEDTKKEDTKKEKSKAAK